MRITTLQQTAPALAVWELTLKCNLRCMHCGSAAGSSRQRELSTTEACQVCQDLSALGCKGIALMGGELLLRKDWQVIAREIKDRGIILSLITNGYIDPKYSIPRLVKLEPECLMVGVDAASAGTHDAIRRVKGAFEKTMTFIRAVKKAGLRVGIITTIHKLNFKELSNIRELVLREELDWQIQETCPIGRFPKHLVLSENEYYALGLFIASLQKTMAKKPFCVVGAHNFGFHSKILPNLSSYPSWNGCYAGKTVLGITSNGDVKGCLTLPDEYIEGNIRKKKISDIWNDPTAFSSTRKFTLKDLGNNCKGCQYRRNCKGGCTTRSHSITGVPHNDPHCFFRIEQEILP
ncbi:MAG: radical SAM protein [Euryarchaeota archaeon]|nr:radical SAM protein [Euryarchaeota archaeon]